MLLDPGKRGAVLREGFSTGLGLPRLILTEWDEAGLASARLAPSPPPSATLERGVAVHRFDNA